MKRNDSQTFKCSNCKRTFSLVCIIMVQLSSNLFYSMWQLEDIFLQSFLLLWSFFNHHVVALLHVFWKRFILIYLHNNSTMLIKNYTVKLSYNILVKFSWLILIFDCVLYNFSLCGCYTFFYEWNIFEKRKISLGACFS